MAESTQPLFAFPSRWTQLADFMSFESAAAKQKFIELMSTRDTDLEDAWPDTSGGSGATGVVVMQKHFAGSPATLAAAGGPNGAQVAWSIALPAGLDPASTYRMVFNFTTSATVHNAGDVVSLKSVWWESQVWQNSIFVSLNPKAKVSMYGLQCGVNGDVPSWTFGSQVSTTVPYNYSEAAGSVNLYNMAGQAGGAGNFWDLDMSVDLLITVYQLDPSLA